MAPEPMERPRILVVEDEWLIADYLQGLLEDMDCVVVGPAADIAAALDLIEAEPVDAALLDVCLGEVRSFPVAERLGLQGVPFRFLTGYISADLDPPFDRCMPLSKPITQADLRGALQQLLDQGVAGAPAV